MKHRRVYSKGLYIFVVAAMILSTLVSIAMPFTKAQAAPSGDDPKILINEFYRAGDFSTSGDEWIELVLIQDMTAADLQGFYVGDSTSTTISKYSAYNFTNMGTIAVSFPKGTIIVVAGGGTAEDTSYAPSGGDWNIVLATNGTHLTGNSLTGNYAGTDVAWVDPVASGSTISAVGFAVNWSPTPGELGLASDVTIAVPANYSGAYLSSDLLGATTPASWITSVPLASLTLGQPNGGANTTYIEGLRSVIPLPTLTIGKAAPATVDVNDPYDYIISVANNLGMTINQVVITDSLPLSLTVGNISDGGELLPGNVVSWTVPTMPDGNSIDRTVSVVAPGVVGELVNFDYGVWASNWLTRTVGISVTTIVRDPDVITPIAEARAAGAGWNGTLRGNVTVPAGIYRNNAFVIQDDTGGMYIYAGSKPLPPMLLGDAIEVKGTLKLYYGLLEIDPLESVAWIDSGAVPSPLTTTTNNVNSNQGWLIQVITGTATWSVADPPPAPGVSDWDFTFNDGSGPVTVFIDKDTNIDMRDYSSPTPLWVIGFSGNYYGAQIMPRYQSDIIDLRPPTVTATNPADGAIGVSPYYPLQAAFNKPMDATTINMASFTLTGPSGAVSGSVSYADNSRTASFTPDAALTPMSVYSALLTTGITDIYGIPMASAYSWSFTTGSEDLIDPAIVEVYPTPDAIEVPLRANVVITFTEDIHPSSLDQEHFILEGPFGAVPNALTYNPSTFVVTLDPESKLLPTTSYTATVKGTVADWSGRTLGDDYSWTFETSVEPPMNVYFGDLHNHTSNSDGSGTPSQALAAGEAAGFDFMAISDHSYAIDDPEWENTLAAVIAATDDDFVALRGFEYTQGAEGHINVYNTVRHAVRTDTGCGYCDYTPNLEAGATVEGFYEWAATTGMIGLDTAGTVMQFNHPGWINFNDWTYHPEVSDIARLEEVGNGNGTSYAFSEDQYIRSLDYGWRVGASNNADTHTAYWGTNTDHRTGVLMSGLTKESLLEALRERRTFATEDKNFSLIMKANGAWMGSEIANTGQVLFEINGADPDGELTALVQIITDQGEDALPPYEPSSADFDWTIPLDISTGVHYFYVRVTQADGDIIVSSPVWTLGSEDIAITDLVIQPTIPTIYNPSLLTVRVTNRNSASRTVTVTMDVNGLPLTPSVEVVVPGNGDASANFSWQPASTGDAIVSAQIIGTPAGDNPDDNQSVLNLTVTDEHLPLILIDAGHGNMNALGGEMQMFINDLSDHQYNVLKNLDELTATDLITDVVKLLIITAPQSPYSTAELGAIADYIAAGGSLWLCGLSDYTGSVPWAATVADRENDILEAIETSTGSQINMRMNDDEIIDADDNNGYVFGPIWGDFPSEGTTSIGMNVEATASWSVSSLRGRNVGEPLTAATPGVQIVVQGDLDDGYGSAPWYDPYHTSNTDADGAGDAYIYNPTWVYPAPTPPDALPVPMAAVTQLANGAGRILLYGDSNDAFTTYAYTAGDGKQNELFNLQAAMWLMGEQLQKSTVAEARAQSVEDQPDNLNKLVWVEGEITAAYGEFFNVLYVQDESGGITVHAPAGDIDPSEYTRGTQVRVVGTVGIYNGDTEIEFFEAEMVQVIAPPAAEPLPLPMSTYQASLEDNQGWLTVITGTVTSKIGEDNLFVDDGSGPVRIFLDGYNGDFSDIQVNDFVRVTGLVSEDGDGHRIRVRNHAMHPEVEDDVVKYELGISKAVATPELILPGSLVTYTLAMSNTGTGTVPQTVLTDTLPTGITFGGFVLDGGAEQQDGTITWSGNMPVGTEVSLVFTATVDMSYSLYGEIITNTVNVASPIGVLGSASAVFTVEAPELSLTKTVATANDSTQPGDAITYTIVVRNDGIIDAVDVHIWDTLPEGVSGEDVNVTITIDAGSVYTLTITATVAFDVLRGSTIINTAHYICADLAGESSASFIVGTLNKFYLPFVRK